jgi:hypothetical protein
MSGGTDLDWSRLSDAVAPGCGLDVVLRISMAAALLSNKGQLETDTCLGGETLQADPSSTHLRVEVAVHEYDRVRGDQVEAHAARPRAQQEDEGAVARVEVVDRRKALLATYRAIEAFVGVATKAQIVL